MLSSQILNDYYKALKDFEGGYSNSSIDYGKETNKGVTRATYDSLAVQLNLSNFYSLTDSDVQKVWMYFYNAYKINYILDSAKALFITDKCWGSGKYAIWVLCDHYKINRTSVMTMALAYFINSDTHFFDIVQGLYDVFYQSIVVNDPKQQIYLAGWERRNKWMTDFCKKKTVKFYNYSYLIALAILISFFAFGRRSG